MTKIRTMLQFLIPAIATCGYVATAQAVGCSANCSIDVIVTADATSCQITAPAKAHVFAVAPGRHDITWKLKGPQGFQFKDPDGIRFSPPAPPDTFDREPSSNRQTFILTDKNDGPTKKGRFNYHIEVEKGSISCKLDPSIVNE